MREEGSCIGPAILRLQDRSLDFEILEIIEICANSRDHARSAAKKRTHLWMNGQIDVPLPRPLFRVSQCRVTYQLAIDDFFLTERERPQTFRQHLDASVAHRHLTRTRPKQWPFDPDDVAEIEMLRHAKDFFAQDIALEVELNSSGRVREMSKRCFPSGAPADETSRETNNLTIRFAAFRIQRKGFHRMV